MSGKKRTQSKTHWAAVVLIALAAVNEQAGVMQSIFGEHATSAALAISAVVMAVLREITKEPIA